MFVFLEFKTVLFFSILLYNTKIYIKLYPTRFLNCKKKKKTLKKVYHMFKEFLCSSCLFFLMLFIKEEF